jgi:DNA topoisomerase-1
VGNIIIIEKVTVPTGIKCEKCQYEMVIKKTKRGVEFLACSNFPRCKNAKNFTRDEATNQIVISKPKVVDEKCPKCGSDILVKTSKFGEFMACSNYPKCKYIKNFSSNVKCPKCGEGEIVYKKGKRGLFYSCNRYPDCKYISQHKPVDTKCSECGYYFLEEHKVKGKDPVLVCPQCKKEHH